jgi:hypothetical protein
MRASIPSTQHKIGKVGWLSQQVESKSVCELSEEDMHHTALYMSSKNIDCWRIQQRCMNVGTQVAVKGDFVVQGVFLLKRLFLAFI